jgi:hypothetical protein
MAEKALPYLPIPFDEWAAGLEIPLDKDCPECEGDPTWSGFCERCTRRHLREYRRQLKADREQWDRFTGLSLDAIPAGGEDV